MTVDKQIAQALSPLGIEIFNSLNPGQGDSETVTERYFVFNYTTVGDDFADDAPQHERYLIQVHFFAPVTEKVNPTAKAVKQALFRAGFTWPETYNASDGNGKHIVFECETSEGADADGDALD